MKIIKLISGIFIIIFTVLSCSSDKKTELAKLKKQQTLLTEKIKSLENGENLVQVDLLDSLKFRLVGFTHIRTNKFDHFIRVQGKLDGDQNASVFADVPGTVSVRYADVGQNVKKGQVLAQIDDQQYQKQLESLETQYKFASGLFEKQKRLWDQKIGSELQYLQSKTTKESLEEQISSLREQLEKFKIKSPVTGTVEECNIKVGSVVSPDPHSAAYRVVAFKSLKISAEVSEAYAAKVNAGDKVTIAFPDINRQIDAKIDFVSRYINPVNRTFIIESRIKDGFPGMKANMIAIVQINDYHSENSIQVPINIVLTDKSGSYIYVIRKKDKYEGAYKQPVVIGITYNGIAEILQGLTVSDKVITTGYQELIDGEYVRSQ